MTNQELIDYWQKAAKDAMDTANTLFIPGKYHHCLFFLHLAIEKISKAVFVKNKNATPPPSHDLLRLAEIAGLKIATSRKLELAEITSFNISARYDDYKNQFYQKATREYTNKWLKIGKNILTEMATKL